jgi:hypothetical protein
MRAREVPVIRQPEGKQSQCTALESCFARDRCRVDEVARLLEGAHHPVVVAHTAPRHQRPGVNVVDVLPRMHFFESRDHGGDLEIILPRRAYLQFGCNPEQAKEQVMDLPAWTRTRVGATPSRDHEDLQGP